MIKDVVMKFGIGDMITMDSGEWPYLSESGKIIDMYINGDNKIAYSVKTLSGRHVGVSPNLCIDYKRVLREYKLKELGI